MSHGATLGIRDQFSDWNFAIACGVTGVKEFA
jgi:hypothetical protein